VIVITSDPDVLGGVLVFRGTRVPVKVLFDYLEGGETLEEFLMGFPGVSREMAIAALEEAKWFPQLRTCILHTTQSKKAA
jgi:uncharacterized protein (DUF433 family)